MSLAKKAIFSIENWVITQLALSTSFVKLLNCLIMILSLIRFVMAPKKCWPKQLALGRLTLSVDQIAQVYFKTFENFKDKQVPVMRRRLVGILNPSHNCWADELISQAPSGSFKIPVKNCRTHHRKGQSKELQCYVISLIMSFFLHCNGFDREF